MLPHIVFMDRLIAPQVKERMAVAIECDGADEVSWWAEDHFGYSKLLRLGHALPITGLDGARIRCRANFGGVVMCSNLEVVPSALLHRQHEPTITKCVPREDDAARPVASDALLESNVGVDKANEGD